MNMIEEYQLRVKYKGLQRNSSDITAIVIHGTGSLPGESYAGLINWMSSESCERKENYKQSEGLFPYDIDLTGDIYDMMPVEDWYFHSEAGQWDRHTIGIEMMNISKTGIRDNSGVYTDAQYKSLFELIKYLSDKYPINAIRSHDANRREFSNLPAKPCPGKNFDWSLIEELVTNNIDRTIEIVRG